MTVEIERFVGEPKVRKIAVVFFHKIGEPRFKLKDNVDQQISRSCGECIDQQVISLSEAGRPVVIDLTVVADCTYLQIYTVQEGYGHPPRGLYVSARNDLCPSLSAGSAACSGRGGKLHTGFGSYGKEVDGDVPAQAFKSGHVIANVRKDYNPEFRREKGVAGKVPRFQLFYAVLPDPATPNSAPSRKKKEHP